ncbi:MAG: hypothetical protein LBM68_05850 [Bacteroidales bacterium]|jgi:hypothetical protein|nr:hypothetical protein [Bacteroidales bacterium]
MKKFILTLVLFISVSISGFSQYIILPKQGNTIEAENLFKNEKFVKYITSSGQRGAIETSEILQILDNNGNNIAINSLKTESEAKAMQPQKQYTKPPKAEAVVSTEIKKTTPAHNKHDLLVTKDAKSIQAVVLEITDSEVKYKKFENQNGPTYSMKRYDIQSIVYSNGEVEMFVDKKDKKEISDICTISTSNGYEIMCKDLTGIYTWSEAQKACPNGFHLPTLNEFRNICERHSQRYDEDNKGIYLYGREYWTSSTNRNNKPYSVTTNDCEAESNDVNDKFSIRCIKD